MKISPVILVLTLLIGAGIAVLFPSLLLPVNIAKLVSTITLMMATYIIVSKVVHKNILFGPPYKPTSRDKLNTIFKLADLNSKDKVVDLGSGDGVLVLEASNIAKQADGYELNPLFYLISKIKGRSKKNAGFYMKNFWNINLNDYDVIFLYGIEYIMEKLEQKLINIKDKSIRVVSNHYVFPNVKPIKQENDVYLYVFGNK